MAGSIFFLSRPRAVSGSETRFDQSMPGLETFEGYIQAFFFQAGAKNTIASHVALTNRGTPRHVSRISCDNTEDLTYVKLIGGAILTLTFIQQNIVRKTGSSTKTKTFKRNSASYSFSWTKIQSKG